MIPETFGNKGILIEVVSQQMRTVTDLTFYLLTILKLVSGYSRFLSLFLHQVRRPVSGLLDECDGFFALFSRGKVSTSIVMTLRKLPSSFAESWQTFITLG